MKNLQNNLQWSATRPAHSTGVFGGNQQKYSRRRIQKQFVEYMQADLNIDHKIDELLDGENMQDMMAWLDSL